MCDLGNLFSKINGFKTLLAGLVLIFLYGLYANSAFAQTLANADFRAMQVIAQEQRFTVHVARDVKTRQVGLMGVRYLPPERGLLMVMPDAQLTSVWMKNMHIGLDVVWISDSGEVLDVMTLYPCKTQSCRTYRSRRPAKYILEVGAGLFPLKTGDKVEILGVSRDSLSPPASDTKAAR